MMNKRGCYYHKQNELSNTSYLKDSLEYTFRGPLYQTISIGLSPVTLHLKRTSSPALAVTTKSLLTNSGAAK